MMIEFVVYLLIAAAVISALYMMIGFAVFLLIVAVAVSVLGDYGVFQRFWKWLKV